jgi:hypothetical protein
MSMQASNDFAFTDGNSGKIAFNGLTYSATTGWVNCIVAFNAATLIQTNAFFQFNTGAFFSGMKVKSIDVVEFFYVEAAAQPGTLPNVMNVYIGDFIGAALNGNSGEFNGGTYMLDAVANGWLSNGNTYYDLSAEGNDPTGFVSLTGTTDVRFKYDSTAGTNGRNFNTTKTKCLLRVTYTKYTMGVLQRGVVVFKS